MAFQRALVGSDLEVTDHFPWHDENILRVGLFGLPLLSATPQQTIETLLSTPRCRAAFVNAHCINVATYDPEYRGALSSANLLLPDGAGLELAAWLQDKRFMANLNGTDLCPLLLAEAEKRDLSVFLLGGRPGVAEAAAKELSVRLPNLRVVGTRDGYSGARGQATIDAVNDSGADILLAALGVPLQDVWLARHHHELKPNLLLGVGALFDFLAGRVRRAPNWMRRARLEWLWRLGLEPRRLFSRYVVGNVLFLARALRARYRTRSTASE